MTLIKTFSISRKKDSAVTAIMPIKELIKVANYLWFDHSIEKTEIKRGWEWFNLVNWWSQRFCGPCYEAITTVKVRHQSLSFTTVTCEADHRYSDPVGTSGQSHKQLILINYESKVVITSRLLIFTAL